MPCVLVASPCCPYHHMPPRKRRTPFQGHHALEYGLSIASRCPETGAVSSVLCQFCRFIGREDKVGQKRKPSKSTKTFVSPFRAELYTQHLTGQHPAKWAEYKSLSDDDKASFFSSATPVANTIISHFAGSSDQMYCHIDIPVIDVIMKKLLFDPEDEEETVDRALSVFVAQLDEDGSVTQYRAHIKNLKLFKLVIGQVALGSSFRLAARQIACVREELSLGYLRACDRGKVASFVRVAAAACLQKLREILCSVWAFSVAFDSATVQTTSYFDVRVRFVIGTTLHCCHLLCLPLFGSHTGQLMFDVFKEAMDALCPAWPDALLATSSDGARNMTGRVRGIVSRVGECVADAGHCLTRFWCGAHQLDLVVSATVASFCDQNWYSTLTALIGYLRRQQNLVNEMRSKCPKVATTRWLSLGKVLPWFSKHRVRITSYLEEKNPPCKPSIVWWLSLLAARRVTDELNHLFKSLQDSAILAHQQTALFVQFIQTLRERVSVEGPLTPQQIEDWDSTSGFLSGSFAVSTANVKLVFTGLGSSEALAFAELPVVDRDGLCFAFGRFVVGLAAGVHDIEPERDNNNDPMTSLPPCDPLAFAKMLPSSFVAVVIRFRTRLEKKFGASYIVALEEEHVALRDTYVKEEAFRSMLDAIDVNTGFCEAWSLVQNRFPKLCEFAGGLASVYPGTARVESDFSIIGWEKDEYRTALMDVSLEGIMHAKQFKDLHAIHTA